MLVKEERRSRKKLLPKKDAALSTAPGSLQSKIVDEVVSLGMEQLKLEETHAPELRCKFHDGKLVNKVVPLASWN